MPGPIDRAWHERLVALLGCRSRPGAGWPVTGSSPSSAAGGQKQFALVVRSADDPDGAAPVSCSIRPTWRPTPPRRSTGTTRRPTADLVAYGISEGGDERSVAAGARRRRPATLRPDEIPDTRAASVGWLPDGSGFLYTRYPEGDEYHRTRLPPHPGHRLGDDELVWDELPTPESWPDVDVSPDGRCALVHVLGRVEPHRRAPARPPARARGARWWRASRR